MRFVWETLLIILACVVSPASAESDPHGLSTTSMSRVELSPEQTAEFLGEISSTLRELKSLRADFVQERRMLAFKDALVARGMMYFQAPDRIRWELSEPYRSALILDGGRVAKLLHDGGQWRKLEVGSKEIMKEVLKLITLWIQGDFESSQELFDLRIEQACTETSPGLTLDATRKGEHPTAQKTTPRLPDSQDKATCGFFLVFTPRSSRMAESVRSIELAMDGESKHIDQVTINENQGDRIVIRFANRECDLELAKDLFIRD